MRNLPPLIISFVVAMVFFITGIGAISKGQEGDRVKAEPESTETPIPTAAPTKQPKKRTYRELIHSRDFSSGDRDILLKIAMAEAEGESTKGKTLVMLVVINRVWSEEFPETIEEVVFQPKQFSTVVEGGRYWTTEPNEDCYEALELLIDGWDKSRGALYFESCEGTSWHEKNLIFLYQYGNHRFYK